MKRHTAKPLPDFRHAKLVVGQETPEAIDHFKACLRRADENAMLISLFSQLEPPAEIDGRKLSKADVQAYALAVNFARGTERDPKQFMDVTAAQTHKASVRFFRICAVAMDAVKRDRDHKFTQTDGHRMAALQAKLELERNIGNLPTQLQVKERAFEIIQRFIKNKNQNFEPLEPNHKRWSKILKSVNLLYLPRGVKSKN